jgi:hypothetical protein
MLAVILPFSPAPGHKVLSGEVSLIHSEDTQTQKSLNQQVQFITMRSESCVPHSYFSMTVYLQQTSA